MGRDVDLSWIPQVGYSPPFMTMEETTSAGKPIVDREKVRMYMTAYAKEVLTTCAQTAPFLIRTFVKVGAYHRLTQFEDGPLPLTDDPIKFLRSLNK